MECILPIWLTACSGGEIDIGSDKAVQACRAIIAMFEEELAPDRRGKIEKTEVKEDHVHLFVKTKNGLGIRSLRTCNASSGSTGDPLSGKQP